MANSYDATLDPYSRKGTLKPKRSIDTPGGRSYTVTGAMVGAMELPLYCKALRVVAAGSVTLVALEVEDDATVIGPFTYAAGEIIPIPTRRITACTATVIAIV